MKNILYYLNLQENEIKGFDKISKNKFTVTKQIIDKVLKQGKNLPRQIRNEDCFEKEQKYNETLEDWKHHGCSISHDYHYGTKDYPFLDYSNIKTSKKDLHIMKKYNSQGKKPNIYQQKRGENIILPKHRELNEKYDCIAEEELTDLKKISTIFYYTLGEIGFMNLPELGKSLLKTAPSGGARHPTEGYLINLSLNGLQKGVYHYNVQKHALTYLKKQGELQNLRKTFFQLNQRGNTPKALLILTSQFERNMWRYREPRSFRVILLDIGHIIANMKLVLNTLNIPHFCGHGFRDKEVEELLDIDGLEEGPFYFFSLEN